MLLFSLCRFDSLIPFNEPAGRSTRFYLANAETFDQSHDDFLSAPSEVAKKINLLALLILKWFLESTIRVKE